ncbi:reverse transcriptase family protein [Shewanella algae]|uniref:reverse transcriptase family protein n=1 Tax=Shewanella algae TaxID=38313 RepID=UPI0031F52771
MNELLHLAANSDSLFFVAKKKKKADGSYRITYDAKPNLKHIHGRIRDVFLKKVDYPNYLHGSLKKRDYLTNANMHVNRKVIISEDVTNFFPSISKRVIHQTWVGVFGFSNEVAELLSELVTFKGALVQGARTSSYLCNLVLWKREADLVLEFSKKGLIYTRYVDDITVSAKYILSKRQKTIIINRLYSILRSIGASPNRSKHKVMPHSGAQTVHRVNVNRRSPSMSKQVRGQIRAAVHQCEKLYQQKPDSLEYRKLFNTVMGRVNTMGRMHETVAGQLKVRLSSVKPHN